MKLDNKYRIKLVTFKENKNGLYDIYDTLEDLDNLELDIIRFGYVIVDDKDNIPDCCNYLNYSPKEALEDYKNNIANKI